MKFLNKVQTALTGEDGASNIEIIVWISVVLVIATALWAFRGSIVKFLGGAKGTVDKLDLK